jgi:hypothetical protein
VPSPAGQKQDRAGSSLTHFWQGSCSDLPGLAAGA